MVFGLVKIGSEVWSAVSDAQIDEGVDVTVQKIDGVKVVVVPSKVLV